MDVPIDAYLAANHTMAADGSGARNSRLGGDHRVVSNLDVVSNLNQVV